MTISPDPAVAAQAAVSVSSLWDLLLKGGPMMIPIGVCSFVVVAVAIERFFVLQRGRVAPPALGDRVRDLVRDSDIPGAREAVRGHASPLAVVLASGLGRAGRPLDLIEKQMAWAGAHEMYALRRRLRILTVVTAVAPLLGLLGTIIGMIKAFQTVALSGESLGKAELLAEGIYEAMITTAAGLLVAIPALVAYHWFASMIERLTHEIDRIAFPIATMLASGATPEPRLPEIRTRSVQPELVGSREDDA